MFNPYWRSGDFEGDPVAECDICGEKLYPHDEVYYDEENDNIICGKDSCLAKWARAGLPFKELPTEKELQEEEADLRVHENKL